MAGSVGSGGVRKSQGKSRLHRFCRVALGTSLLGAVLGFGTLTLSTPPAGAASCDITAVAVTVHNNTNATLRLDAFEHGVTNLWCSPLPNPIPPHVVAHFEAGDGLFATELHVSYVAPNHDTLGVYGAAAYFGVVDARCTVVPNGRTPSPYRCSATARKDSERRGGVVTHVARVDWVISE